MTFLDIQRKLIDLLLKIPGIESFQVRSSLLQGLPALALQRNESMARVDLAMMIDSLRQLGRLDRQNGTRPLIILVDNALQYVPVSSAIGEGLVAIKECLGEYYGGDLQPEPSHAVGAEALIFGQQRDSRLPYRFIDGALRVARGIARVTVPRMINGIHDGNYVYGTGWLIAAGVLVTNYHVIAARDRRAPPRGFGDSSQPMQADLCLQTERISARFDYWEEQQAPDDDKRECRGAVLLAHNQDLDYAVVQLTETHKIADRLPLRIIEQQPQVMRGSRLNIAQHANGGPLLYAIRNNFFVQNGENVAFMRYQTDTEPGASGAPVCDDAWNVVALHRASIEVAPRQVAEEVIEGRPVLVNVLNEAVTIHAILMDLPAPIRDRIITPHFD